MRTWIKLASLALVAALAAGARAQDKPRNDDRPRDDTKTRTTEERTRTTEERTRTTEDRTRTDDKALTDNHFVDHAYTMGQNEVLLARLALQRSRNEDVRKFAAKIIEDHGKCGNDLIIVVSELRIAIPDRPLKEQEEGLRRLHDPAVTDFDRVYIEHSMKGHDEAVQLYERASKELKNERLKGYAEKSLTTLKEHQKLAKETLAKVGGSGERTTETRTTERTTRTTDDTSRGLTDNDFVMKASASGKAEVEIGKLGQEKGKSADLKKFADRVVTDHSKVNVELTRVARDAGLSVSEKPAEQDEHVQHLRDQSDKNFDKAFAKHMVESHTKGVELFTKASKELKNEKLRSLAEKTLPTLKEHLQMAKDLQAKVDRE